MASAHLACLVLEKVLAENQRGEQESERHDKMRRGERDGGGYHEAGCAVIASVLGLPCGSARIAADENGAAQELCDKPKRFVDRR